MADVSGGATAYDRILERLQAHGSEIVERGGNQVEAQCPSHNDGRPSLVITGIAGQALMHCRANCQISDVLDKLDLNMRDLFDDHRGVTYTYDDGRTVQKTPDKQIYQNGHKPGYVTLYRRGAVVSAAAKGDPVYLVEGEKDVRAIEAAGATGTTAPMGAGNFGLVDIEPLKGADVIVIPDQDAPGMQWAATVRERLDGWAKSLTFRHPQVGKDFADHLAAGLGLSDLLPTPETDLPTSEADERVATLEAMLVDTNGLESIPEPDPIVEGMLYRDSLAWIFGAPGSAKSFVALDIAGAVGGGHKWHAFPATQGPVLYLVAEGVSGVKRRVRAWEDYYDRRMDGVTFLPVAVQAGNAGEWATFVRLVAKRKPSMIIVDTQARVTEGMDENSNTEMGQLVGRLEDLRKASGACVLTVHHTGRNGEHMRGAIALDGAATTIVKAVKKKGEDAVDLECFKQKDAAPFDDIRLILTSHETSAVLKWQGVSSKPLVSSKAMQASLIRWWKAYGDTWATGPQLKESSDGNPPLVAKTTFYEQVDSLIANGTVRKEENVKRPRFRLVKDPTNTVPDTVRTVPDSVGAPGRETVRPVRPPYGADRPDTRHADARTPRKEDPSAPRHRGDPKCHSCHGPVDIFGDCPSCDLVAPF